MELIRYLYTIIFSLFCIVLSSSQISGMQNTSKAQELKYDILPKEMCLALCNKLSPEVTILRNDFRYHASNLVENVWMSATWNTGQMTPEDLFEHQMWVGTDNNRSRFRFDNDSTHDCNEFYFDEYLGGDTKIIYDGPNNDGGKNGGVILVGHSYRKNYYDEYQTVIYLFKQHNMNIMDYKGVQPKKTTNRIGGATLVYNQFPYVSPAQIGHKLDFCALAPCQRGIVATTDREGVHHLHAFDYTCTENKTDQTKPDQSFIVTQIASCKGTPLFKRFAWVYGRTLVGISDQNELYVIVLKEAAGEQSTIEVYKQKVAKKFKNICVGRPSNHHEVILCDEEDNLYYVNLKCRATNGGFSFKLIQERIPSNSYRSIEAKKYLPDGTRLVNPDLKPVDRVWLYENKLTTVALNASSHGSSIVRQYNLDKKIWTPEGINYQVHEIKKEIEKEQSTRAKLVSFLKSPFATINACLKKDYKNPYAQMDNDPLVPLNQQKPLYAQVANLQDQKI